MGATWHYTSCYHHCPLYFSSTLSLSFFFFCLHGFQDLNSPTRDWTQALGSKSAESYHGPSGNTPFSFALAVCPLFLLLFQPLKYFVYIIGLHASRLVVKKGAVPSFTPPSAPPHSSDFILMNILDNILGHFPMSCHTCRSQYGFCKQGDGSGVSSLPQDGCQLLVTPILVLGGDCAHPGPAGGGDFDQGPQQPWSSAAEAWPTGLLGSHCWLHLQLLYFGFWSVVHTGHLFYAVP